MQLVQLIFRHSIWMSNAAAPGLCAQVHLVQQVHLPVKEDMTHCTHDPSDTVMVWYDIN